MILAIIIVAIEDINVLVSSPQSLHNAVFKSHRTCEDSIKNFSAHPPFLQNKIWTF
jgi:hypothetical protein